MSGIAISDVEKDSIAWEGGIRPGDTLLSINGETIKDVFDYRFLLYSEELVIVVEGKDGQRKVVEVEKDEDEDLGICFETYLMDCENSCSNNCIFCFIDQLPPGMRDTMYFKDDDARLSFLSGNYATLTNMAYSQLDRIIKYRLSPINISVHATDPEIRKRMMGNSNAGDILEKMRYLANADIAMNAQIVLCKNINDGDVLKKSLSDLEALCPQLRSVSVVPLGMTDYRQGLEELEPHDAESARETLEIIHQFQHAAMEKYGTRVFFAGDELYLMSDTELPTAAQYEGFPQLENGVGMMAKLYHEFKLSLSHRHGSDKKRKVSLATGALAYKGIKSLCEKLGEKYPMIEVNVYKIDNDFFGRKITVSGLLTGQDIYYQLKDEDLGEELILPENMLKADEDIFLDDWTPDMLSDALGGIEIKFSGNTGADFIDAVVGEHEDKRGYKNGKANSGNSRKA